VVKVLKEFLKKPETYRISREDKIALHKEEKLSRSEMEKVENEKDRMSREIHLRQFDCINMWLYFPMEKKMMLFRQKLEDDKEAKQKFDNRHKDKPKKKVELQYMQINHDGTLSKFLII
jgi:hypothetical protein